MHHSKCGTLLCDFAREKREKDFTSIFMCFTVSVCSSRNLIALENDSCKTILDVDDETFRDDEKKIRKTIKTL